MLVRVKAVKAPVLLNAKATAISPPDIFRFLRVEYEVAANEAQKTRNMIPTTIFTAPDIAAQPTRLSMMMEIP